MCFWDSCYYYPPVANETKFKEVNNMFKVRTLTSRWACYHLGWKPGYLTAKSVFLPPTFCEHLLWAPHSVEIFSPNGSQLLNFCDPFHPKMKTPLRCVFPFYLGCQEASKQCPVLFISTSSFGDNFFCHCLIFVVYNISTLCSHQMTAPLLSPVPCFTSCLS